jgi:hypothetical protein
VLAIREALNTLGLREFLDEFWDREVAFVQGSESVFRDLGKLLVDIGSFLDRTDIRFPSLRLVKDGVEIPLEDYAKELRLGPHLSNDWIDNERVFHEYRQGATIVLQLLHNSLPSLAQAVNDLEELFGCNIHVSCFITPPGSQGFTAHYDTYSFFAIQLFGEKRWSLYNNTPLLPIREDREIEEPWTPVPPARELTMRAGDLLYVPRGRYHSALTSTTASVHVTVGLFAVNWLDVFRASWAPLQSDPRLRSCPPRMQEAGIRGSGEAEGIKADILRQINLAAGIEKLEDEVFARHVDSRCGRLLDLLELSAGGVVDRYCLQSIPYRLEGRGGNIVLRFANKELCFPGYVEPVLKAMCESASVFSAEELPRALDDDSKRVLLRVLVEEGFLGIPRSTV